MEAKQDVKQQCKDYWLGALVGSFVLGFIYFSIAYVCSHPPIVRCAAIPPISSMSCSKPCDYDLRPIKCIANDGREWRIDAVFHASDEIAYTAAEPYTGDVQAELIEHNHQCHYEGDCHKHFTFLSEEL